MSERSSFVTDYIYCPDCFGAVRKWMFSQHIDKYFCPTVVRIDPSIELPIIAGKIGALASGGELLDFEFNIVPELRKLVCHPLRIAVLADCGVSKIFVIEPALP